ncbi:MAG: hypothetical protein ACRD8W_10680 [Nitrososphaeraceae archaeon]
MDPYKNLRMNLPQLHIRKLQLIQYVQEQTGGDVFSFELPATERSNHVVIDGGTDTINYGRFAGILT